MRLAVILLPGCSPLALQRPGAADADVRIELVAPGDGELPNQVAAVALVGGAADGEPMQAPIMATVAAFAAAGGPVIGIGAGFRALCTVGLLPGTLEPIPGAARAACDLVLRVEGQPTPFTRAVAAGRLLRVSGAQVGWRYEHEDPVALERAGQVVFRYVDEEGGLTGAADPGGSVRNIAGVCDGPGRVVGLAAHPGDPSAALLGAVDGVRLLDSLREHLQDARAPRQ